MSSTRGTLVCALALLLLVVPAGCGEEARETEGLPVGQIQLPTAQLEAIRARVRKNLFELQRRCLAHNVTASQIYAALNSADWTSPGADLLDKMPDAIRALMKEIREDIAEHNRLLVDTVDRAEGRVEGGQQ